MSIQEENMDVGTNKSTDKQTIQDRKTQDTIKCLIKNTTVDILYEKIGIYFWLFISNIFVAFIRLACTVTLCGVTEIDNEGESS